MEKRNSCGRGFIYEAGETKNGIIANAAPFSLFQKVHMCKKVSRTKIGFHRPFHKALPNTQ